MIQYMLSNFSQPHLENEMGRQADERSETIRTAKREDNACICSSLHVQGTFTYTDSHRCLLHNDTMEHDCTTKNIVPGLIVPGDGQLDTPQAVEDWCICTSLHIHGNLVNVCYYHRCQVHNDTLENMDEDDDDQSEEDMDTEDDDDQSEEDMDTEDDDDQSEEDMDTEDDDDHGNSVNIRYYHRCPVHIDTLEHDCTHNNIVTGQSNFVQFDEQPETISTPESAEDTCVCSTLHIQESSAYKYQYRCPVHNDTEEHNCMRRNTVIGRGS